MDCDDAGKLIIIQDMKIDQVVSFRFLDLDLHQSGSFKMAATMLLA
jgi:hypothetical protein